MKRDKKIELRGRGSEVPDKEDDGKFDLKRSELLK